ncbi:GNAT family N-acetyltransferase [Fictibacillus nanhaiensis]|uniref:GNAT family N-acetyltransferase n=1 Tax=Fictibacillus nanhaiensis TaxID=742169 RepID=UPI002E20150A|nr:GNAT family N-acetyltransferase [Fictibacillus nanhaiensis]MED1865239.1 GNAT family N-acetyltransferase [Fictibacillus nanhaiensis]
MKVRKYENKDHQAALEYILPPEQAIFTSIPAEVLATFRNDIFNQPFVIYSNQQLVGWFALYTEGSGNIYTNNKQAILLKSFSIDVRFQKRGFGLDSLKLLPNIVKQQYKDKNEIILTVHETNDAAISLYRKAGFIHKGENYNGEYGIEMIFRMSL